MLFLFGCVLLVLFSLSTVFTLLDILFGSGDPGSMIMLFIFDLGITLTTAYLMRNQIRKRLSQGGRRKTDLQRLNQLQLLPPNAALPAIQPQNIIALDLDEEAYASVDVVLMETAATGELVITPKRLIFSGNMQTLIFPLEEILGILPTEGGFIINSDYSNRTIKIRSDIQRQIFDSVIRRVLQDRQR